MERKMESKGERFFKTKLKVERKVCEQKPFLSTKKGAQRERK